MRQGLALGLSTPPTPSRQNHRSKPSPLRPQGLKGADSKESPHIEFRRFAAPQTEMSAPFSPWMSAPFSPCESSYDV